MIKRKLLQGAWTTSSPTAQGKEYNKIKVHMLFALENCVDEHQTINFTLNNTHKKKR